ncbi:hypothetical protein [Sandarakinorhabdus sp. DWP1-3-1]|uniref:hypothetical protein n=1 Tax=Sandarakinorhabdus sp. DWP1-3-1 TaxID=2804627 RepID=UPI003CEBBF8C
MRRLARLTLVAAAVATPMLAAPASASTDAAMARGMAQAGRACLKASELKNAAIVGEPILFSDATGKTAILVTGRWRPAHMRNARATMLCLYDRSTRRAETQEALRWTVAAR